MFLRACVSTPKYSHIRTFTRGVLGCAGALRLFGYQSRIISAHRVCGQAHSKGYGCCCSGCRHRWKGSLQNSIRVQNTQLAFSEGMKCGTEYIINEWWKTLLSIYSHIQLHLASVFLPLLSRFFTPFRFPRARIRRVFIGLTFLMTPRPFPSPLKEIHSQLRRRYTEYESPKNNG